MVQVSGSAWVKVFERVKVLKAEGIQNGCPMPPSALKKVVFRDYSTLLLYTKKYNQNRNIIMFCFRVC